MSRDCIPIGSREFSLNYWDFNTKLYIRKAQITKLLMLCLGTLLIVLISHCLLQHVMLCLLFSQMVG
jgi:hypothetical protein